MKSLGFILDADVEGKKEGDDTTRSEIHVEDTGMGPTVDDATWIIEIWVSEFNQKLLLSKPQVERLVEALQEINGRYEYEDSADAAAAGE